MLSSQLPELKEAGFYVTGFNKLLDYFLFPVIMILLSMRMDSLAAGLFKFGLKFSKPPFGARLVAECRSESKKIAIRIDDANGYNLTAIPIVACLRQYLDGTINEPGLYWQSWVVEPDRLFIDMKEMGLEFKVSQTSLS